MVIELDEEEFSQLLVMLGYAVGAATRDGHQILRDHFLRLSNAVNRKNPRWSPYHVLEAKRKDHG